MKKSDFKPLIDTPFGYTLSLIPPKVEYRLSKKGESLIPILDEMCKWGSKERPDLVKYIEK